MESAVLYKTVVIITVPLNLKSKCIKVQVNYLSLKSLLLPVYEGNKKVSLFSQDLMLLHYVQKSQSFHSSKKKNSIQKNKYKNIPITIVVN